MAGFAKKTAITSSPEERRSELLSKIQEKFVPATQLEVRDSVKIALYGAEKTGKTHFCCTAKRPLYVIDTEGAWNWEIERMRAAGEDVSDIHVSQVLQFANRDEGKIDLIGSLDALIESIDLVTSLIALSDPNAPRGTIIVDDMTDLWEWLGIWLDEVPNKQKSGDRMSRFEWGKANKRYTDVIYMLLLSNWNVVLTFRTKPVIDEKGGDTSNMVARWQKNTGYYVDCIVEMQFEAADFTARFHKGRLGKFMYGKTMKNPTWPNMIEFIKKTSGMTIY